MFERLEIFFKKNSCKVGSDAWSHLVDPDPRLSVKHFILALPENMPHDEAWIKIRRAHQNLELARWRPSSWTQQSWNLAMDRPFEVAPPVDNAMAGVGESNSGLEELIKSTYTLNQHLIEGQCLMVNAINKFTSIAEGSIRDTSQSIRSIFDNSMDRLHAITGAASTMAVPIVPPTTPSAGGTSSTPASTSTQKTGSVAPPRLKKKAGKAKPL